MSGHRIGFAGSLLLHCGLLGIGWALADIPRPSAAARDHLLPLTLAMFQEVPPAPHEPVPAAVRGLRPEASAKSTVEPPPKHQPEARKVREPAKRAPAEGPALTPVTRGRAPTAAEKPSLHRKPKATPVAVARAAEPRPIPWQPARQQRHAPPRSVAARGVAKRSRNNLSEPAAVAAVATPADIAAASGAQSRRHSERAVKLEDEYLEKLWRALERSKFYPRQARRRGLQGLVQVRFRVLRDGSFDDLEVVVGSGNRLLDAAAVQTVSKVSGAFPFPSALPKQALVVSLPITYRWQ